jgi:CheY-like chemotaxis protein
MDSQIVLLLVEDEPLIRLAMQDALEGGGYAVLTAANGTDALALLDGRHLDLDGVSRRLRF